MGRRRSFEAHSGANQSPQASERGGAVSDYPTDEELKRIEKWPYSDPLGWLKFVESIWWMADWGITWRPRRVYISTGGWSGNEDIIESMKKNFILWSQLWVSVRRGGHYVFENRKKLALSEKKGAE
jgi:hypothetical protein